MSKIVSKRNPYIIQIESNSSLHHSGQQEAYSNKTNLRYEENPLKDGTLGYFGLSTKLPSTNSPFPLSLLIIPYDSDMLYGIDPISIRIFRWDDSLKFLYPIWNSGVNESHKFLWAKIRQPGIFVAIGLPIDNLLR